MQLTDESGRLRIIAPAKINLFLKIVGKRTDGFHELESIMQTINLFDTLYFYPDQKNISVETFNATIPSSGNIVYRAAELIRKRYGIKIGVKIELHKRIPMGGGLGGGSSNAAATLLGLNCLWDLGLSTSEMVYLAMQLGSDVPFFLYGQTALVKGRGEIVFPIPIRTKLCYLLLFPPFSVPTKLVYDKLKFSLTEKGNNVTLIVKELIKSAMDYEKLRKLLSNRLEPVALELYPELHNIFGVFRENAGAGILLSGSGSTIFKLCTNEAEAEKLSVSENIRKLGRVFVAQASI